VKSLDCLQVVFFSPAESAIPGKAGEFELAWRSMGTMLGFHLSLPTRCWMLYYSCQTIILLLIRPSS
jgi:hypothetical protein